MRTSNPILNEKNFDHEANVNKGKMTIQGTVNKTLLLTIMLFISATYVWTIYIENGNTQNIGKFITIGMIVSIIFAIITILKKEWSMFTTPIYAIAEGLCLGGVSSIFEQKYPGIVIQSVAVTFAVLFALIMIYKAKLLVATDNFRKGVLASTGGIALIYLITFILSFFSIEIPYIHDGGSIGIMFSLAVVIIASLNLVLDFDFIERASKEGAPKYMEWYGAFGLIVTLVWLYVEVLNLLSKLSSKK